MFHGNGRIQEESESMEFEALCAKMVGKKVRVRFKDGGAPIIGECIGYTRAIDNDSEIAEIDIDTGISNTCYSLMESEISDIEKLKN